AAQRALRLEAAAAQDAAGARVPPRRPSCGLPRLPPPLACVPDALALAVRLRERADDRVTDLARARGAADVAGADAGAAGRLDRAHQPACGVALAELLEHQHRAPDRADRVRDPLPGDVRRRA